MAKTLLQIEQEHGDFCQEVTRHLVLYAAHCSYGSTLRTERLFEHLFMHVESLFEDAFMAYTMGAFSAESVAPTRRIVLPDESVVSKLLSGQKDFPDWTQWDHIISMSELFFDPSPFSALRCYTARLNELKTIRNALAHISGTSQSKFQTLVRDKLGYFPATGMTVAQFLLTHVKGKATHYFQDYIDMTRGVAALICHWK